MNGWPFLIARGRGRGYGVLLAPDLLRADYGLLEEVAGPLPAAEPVRVASARTGRGEGLTVAWSEHRVTAADLADGTEPRDEHSRPLRLLYGFACREAIQGPPSDVDMTRAKDAALATYRRFLADERGFTVETSAPFELRSVAAVRPAARSDTRPSTMRRYAIPLTVAGLAIGAIIVAIIMLSSPEPEKQPPDPPRPTQTSTTRPLSP
jgi:hypothetical protein